jgi:hypothetical protein
MAPYKELGNRVDLLDLGHRIAHQGWAFAVGAGEAFICTAADIVDIAIVKLRIIADV